MEVLRTHLHSTTPKLVDGGITSLLDAVSKSTLNHKFGKSRATARGRFPDMERSKSGEDGERENHN